jgi:hypothetical protein
MAPADAEDHFAFISFDCCLYALASLVTHFSAKVCCVDRLLAGFEPVPYPSVIAVTAHFARMPSDSQE